jgi:cell division protein FtsI (penicillin-binding protein 3)
MAVYMVVVLIAVAGVTARLVDVQIVGRQRYVQYGLTQRDGYRVLPAGRGAIYDRDGRAFAMSVAEPRLVIDPTQLTDLVPVTTAIARATDRTRGDVARELRDARLARTKAGNPVRYHVVKGDITAKEAVGVKALKLPGVSTEDHFVRTDPTGDLARALVGHAIADDEKPAEGTGQGVSGLEKQYDRALHGVSGKYFYERDPNGRTIAGGRSRTIPAKPGADLYLTLDQSLQYEAEQALINQVQATGAKGAMAVIMKPSTGEVLSMASVGRSTAHPDVVTGTGDAQPLTSVFEPGSVNKMITIAGAIEEKKVTPETVLDVPDHLQIYDKDFTDHDPHPTQPWSVTDILVTSSNIGTIKIARQLGATDVDRYLRAFGFGRSSGLGFPAESGGIMRPLSDWSGVDIGAIPIGQGIAVTALQMLSAYNVVANDGVYVAPKLVGATDHGDGRSITAASGTHRVISPETARAMRGMLDQVVTDGTGKLAAVPGYPIGGKTGTARTPQADHAPGDAYMAPDGYHYQSSFVGFVDGADLSIMVTLQDAKTSIYGGDVAAPVFSHLAAMALRRYQIAPPGLVAAAERAVPALSASAKEVKGEDVTDGSHTQGN